MQNALKQTLRDVDCHGVRALVRVDFSVPLTTDGSRVSDDSRIRAVKPTIDYLIQADARIVLCSHFGRPNGLVVEELCLLPAQTRLSQILDREVKYAAGPTGLESQQISKELAPGDVALLENLRFDPREEANDDEFAQELASLGDLFINDAFGVAHRAHASTVGVSKYLPSVAGLLMARELEMLGWVTDSPTSPVMCVVGGAKVLDKIGIIMNLADRVDFIMIGGGMVASFAAALGHSTGASEVSDLEIQTARNLLELADVSIMTPVDVVTATEASYSADPAVYPINKIPADAFIFDIGPKTAGYYAERIMNAKTIIWNGPMGIFEWPPFAGGTQVVASAVALNKGAISIAGGGSTAAAIGELGLAKYFDHVSTGGGAALEFMEGKILPGIAALDDLQI